MSVKSLRHTHPSFISFPYEMHDIYFTICGGQGGLRKVRHVFRVSRTEDRSSKTLNLYKELHDAGRNL